MEPKFQNYSEGRPPKTRFCGLAPSALARMPSTSQLLRPHWFLDHANFALSKPLAGMKRERSLPTSAQTNIRLATAWSTCLALANPFWRWIIYVFARLLGSWPALTNQWTPGHWSRVTWRPIWAINDRWPADHVQWPNLRPRGQKIFFRIYLHFDVRRGKLLQLWYYWEWKK